MSKGKKKDQDLTRIENLSEFIHEDDTAVDRLFESFNSPGKSSSSEDSATDSHDEEGSRLYNLDELEDSPETTEEVESEYSESSESFDSSEVETTDFSSEEESDFTDYQSTEEESDSFAESSWDSPLADDSPEESQEEYKEDKEEEAEEDQLPPPIPEEINESFFQEESPSSFSESEEEPSFEEPPYQVANHYSEVKSFGNNITPNEHFSTAANPPYSIVIENIQYKEDAKDLQKVLEDFEIITAANASDYQVAINNGRVLVPQISEYKAIMLGHALRKFNFSIQVGLSHQVFSPSVESAEFKGLISKKFSHQNLKENATRRERNFEIEDIHITSLSEIPDFEIIQLHDVKTLMSVISQEELQRLEFVESALRAHDFAGNIDQSSIDEAMSETIEAYMSYQKSFEYLYSDMILRLRQEAFDLGLNAVLGINFNLTLLPTGIDQKTSYTITCTSTFATVSKKS